MAFFDFLKPRWSASKMTQDDRARRLWFLQAITSYTAWQRCRDRYAVFVDLVERQCREEPVGRLGPIAFEKYKSDVGRWVQDGEFPASALSNLENVHRTDWNASTYAAVLRGLSLYDQGLARLKQGDRTVFLHNSQGVLEDAYHAADHQFQMYYLGGRNGGDGMVFYGKYVAAMKAALLWADEHEGFRAGGLQPMMAKLSAPDVWETPHDYRDLHGNKRHDIGTSASLKLHTAHLKTLPRVIEPLQEVTVYSGEPCPAFGVYEPQVTDGVMSYMCAGQEAYRYGEPCSAPGAGTAVHWKLVWEDTRYRDGVIPEEEQDYYPTSNTPPDFSRLVGEELSIEVRSDEIVVAKSGEAARYSGTWAVKYDLSGRIFWRKGDPLPLHKGQPVEWVYSGI
jgi:hypothetical protein